MPQIELDFKLFCDEINIANYELLIILEKLNINLFDNEISYWSVILSKIVPDELKYLNIISPLYYYEDNEKLGLFDNDIIFQS